MASASDFKVKQGLQVAGGDINLGNAQNAVIQVDAVSGTNTAGKTLTISGGEGTGSGVGGSIIFQTADGGGSGSSANSLATALTIADDLAATFAGAVSLNGAVTLGNATGDDITATGRLASDLIPKTDSSYDLGSSTLQFAEAHIDTGHIDALTVTGTSTLSTVDIGAGAVDGTTVGASSASTGAFTTLSATGAVTATNTVTVGVNDTGHDVKFFGATSGKSMLWDESADQLKIVGTASSVALDVDTGDFTVGAYGLTNAGAATIASMAGNWTNAGRTVADLGTITTVDINGGTVDGATVGAASASTGAFTTLTASGATTLNGAITLGDGTDDDITNTGRWVGDFVPKVDSSIDLGTSTLQFAEAHIDAGYIDAITVTGTSTLSTVDIGAGAIDGTTIGAASAAAGTFAALVGTSLSVSDGNITNVGQIALDAIAPDSNDIQMKLDDDRAAAFDITQASNSYMKFVTTDTAENIIVGIPLFTIGDGTAEDTKIIFDGTEVDFRLGIDDGTDSLEIGPGAAHGTTAGLIIDGNGHVTQIGQSTAGASKYLKWDNSNSRAVWDTVSGTASSILADDIADGDGAVEIETSTGGVDISTDAVNQALTMGNTSGATVINGLTLDVNSAGVSTLDAVTSHTITTPITAITSSTSVTATTPLLSIESGATDKPVVQIKNTNNGTDGAELKFVTDDGQNGADGDDLGTISFYGDNDAQQQTKFVQILAEVSDASDGAEGGQLSLGVATHDGEMQYGLVMTDGSLEDEIDVRIGNGSSSVTTIAGNLTVSGATTTISSTVLEVTDDMITVSKGNDTLANAEGSGIEIDCENATNPTLTYQNTPAGWESNVHMNLASGKEYKINDVSILTATTIHSNVTSAAGITTVGALASGSIASGFGTISTGNAITTTALITGGSLDIDDVVINGTTIGHTDDTDLLTVANGSLTLAGTLNQESTALMDAYSATLTTTSATTMFTIASNAYSAGKVLVSVWREDSSSDDHRSVTEFLFTYQGDSTPSASSNIHMTEYSLVDTSGSQLATFDVVKDSGNILVQITPASSDQTKVRAQITQLAI